MSSPMCFEEPRDVKLVVKNSFLHLQITREQISESDDRSYSHQPRCRANSAPGILGHCSSDKENSSRTCNENSLRLPKASATKKQAFLARLTKKLTKPAVKADVVPSKTDTLPTNDQEKEGEVIEHQAQTLPFARSPVCFVSTPDAFDGSYTPAYRLPAHQPEPAEHMVTLAAAATLQLPSPPGMPLQKVQQPNGFFEFTTCQPSASAQAAIVFVATPSALPQANVCTVTPSASPQIQRTMFRRETSSSSNDSQEASLSRVNSRSSTDSAGSSNDGKRTTLMLRNLPNDYTRDMLLNLLDCQGFAGAYDFTYLPIDFSRLAGLGYAFVNCVSPDFAERMKEQLQGFDQWCVSSQKVCEVCWGNPLQGLEAHIERYRNSPVMHQSVPDEYKPAIFVNGVRSTFPAPTKRIRTLKKTASSNH